MKPEGKYDRYQRKLKVELSSSSASATTRKTQTTPICARQAVSRVLQTTVFNPFPNFLHEREIEAHIPH